MALRLNKTSKVIFAVSIVVLSGALGYLIWRVNQKETTAPGDSMAGENSCNCCENLGNGSIPTCLAHPDPDIPCSCTYVAGACGGVEQCTISECTEGSDCNLNCYWPQVNFCNRTSGGKCECRSTNNRCTAPDPDCKEENLKCPSGYTKCESNCGSDYKTVSCTGHCEGCNNKYIAQIKCKKNATTPVCGDGKKDSTEDCDYKASPTGCKTGYSCSNKCKCVALCGNGVKNTGEDCDYKASPTGCKTGFICSTGCKCVSNVVCGNGKIDTGEACDPKAVPNGCKAGEICQNDCTCSAVTEDTCGDGTLDQGEECEVGNPSGNSCLWTTCNQTTCLCKALTITKKVVESCLDEGTDNPTSVLSYTVTVANSGTENRTITKIEDVLDTKILDAGITPSGITTPGKYSNGTILWDYQTTNLVIKGGETKIYKYKVNIDKDNFGEYTNTVTLTRATGVTSKATTTINADCVIEVPKTGIFDNTLGRIAAGVFLLVIGGVIYNIPNRVLLFKKSEETYKYRGRFEKRVANR